MRGPSFLRRARRHALQASHANGNSGNNSKPASNVSHTGPRRSAASDDATHTPNSGVAIIAAIASALSAMPSAPANHERLPAALSTPVP